MNSEKIVERREFMLLNLLYTLSALVALGLCVLTGAFESLAWLWLMPLGFVVTLVLGLLTCYLIIWDAARRTDKEKEFETDDPFIRTIVKYYAPTVFRLLGCKLETRGTENLPKDGRFLLVSNHLCDLDPGFFLKTFCDDQLAFIAKKEVRDMPIVGVLMRRLLCQFVNRENDREALKTILKCIAILKEDKASVAVFPEGRITKDGKLLHHFRPGVFKIAQKANVPIVVCTLKGAEDLFDNVKKLRRSRVHLHLVGVIPAEELKGVTTVDIAARVHAMMAEDLGAEHVAA